MGSLCSDPRAFDTPTDGAREGNRKTGVRTRVAIPSYWGDEGLALDVNLETKARDLGELTRTMPLEAQGPSSHLVDKLPMDGFATIAHVESDKSSLVGVRNRFVPGTAFADLNTVCLTGPSYLFRSGSRRSQS